MLYLATVSFSGVINMVKGKVGEISDPALEADLLKAGYIVPYKATDNNKVVRAEAPEAEKPKSKRKGKSE